MTPVKREREKVAELVHAAGGQIVGRTRLQKIAYLLELTGQGDGFDFEYRHYGPYSETLSEAIRLANAFGLVEEEERVAHWGGRYSIYKVCAEFASHNDNNRARFATTAASVSSVELELAATAAYLSAVEDVKDPWEETMRRKPEKAADGRLEKAKEAYRVLLNLQTPKPLPKIA
jgi:uncharacterized protein YwgA